MINDKWWIINDEWLWWLLTDDVGRILIFNTRLKFCSKYTLLSTSPQSPSKYSRVIFLEFISSNFSKNHVEIKGAWSNNIPYCCLLGWMASRTLPTSPLFVFSRLDSQPPSSENPIAFIWANAPATFGVFCVVLLAHLLVGTFHWL